MKQTINPDDISMLNDSQREKIKSWWKPAFGDIVYNERSRSLYVVVRGVKKFDKDDFPILSVGQMIEFINTKTSGLLKIKGSGGIWSVHMLNEFWEETRGFGPNKLCDTLWEAVKEVLNEKPI